MTSHHNKEGKVQLRLMMAGGEHVNEERAMHYGPEHHYIPALIIHCPMSLGVSE